MRWPIGILLLAPAAFGCSCTEDAPACERFPQARATFIGTVLEGNDNRPDRVFGQALYLVRVEEAFSGLTTDQKEVFIDPDSFTSCQTAYEVGDTFLFYAGGMRNVVATSIFPAGGPAGAFPARWTEKANLKVYSAPMCSGSKPVKNATLDVAWIRQALRGETATRVSGVAYQQYSQYADKDENVPLAGATVRLQASSGPALTTVSGADGEYAFDAIAPGEYHLWADRPPWIESYRQKILVRQGGCVERPLRLESRGSVGGIVRKADGTPARNAEVELVRLLRDGTLATSSAVSKSTEADGRFLMRSVPAGRFVLGVNVRRAVTAEEPWAPTYYPGVADPKDARVFDLEPDGAVAGLAFKLPAAMPVRSVNVRVFWADGTEAVGARVAANPVERPFRFNMLNRASNGHVAPLRLMQHYSYRISADWYLWSREGPLHVESGEILLPKGKEDVVVDVRLEGNRPTPPPR